MTRDPLLYIEDILTCIENIERYTAGADKMRFAEDTQLQDAVVRRLEIIGEAVKNIPAAITGRYPDIPWRTIAGLRDVLVHEYFGVNIERVWTVVTEDISPLKGHIQAVARDIAGGS